MSAISRAFYSDSDSDSSSSGEEIPEAIKLRQSTVVVLPGAEPRSPIVPTHTKTSILKPETLVPRGEENIAREIQSDIMSFMPIPEPEPKKKRGRPRNVDLKKDSAIVKKKTKKTETEFSEKLGQSDKVSSASAAKKNSSPVAGFGPIVNDKEPNDEFSEVQFSKLCDSIQTLCVEPFEKELSSSNMDFYNRELNHFVANFTSRDQYLLDISKSDNVLILKSLNLLSSWSNEKFPLFGTNIDEAPEKLKWQFAALHCVTVYILFMRSVLNLPRQNSTLDNTIGLLFKFLKVSECFVSSLSDMFVTGGVGKNSDVKISLLSFVYSPMLVLVVENEFASELSNLFKTLSDVPGFRTTIDEPFNIRTLVGFEKEDGHDNIATPTLLVLPKEAERILRFVPKDTMKRMEPLLREKFDQSQLLANSVSFSFLSGLISKKNLTVNETAIITVLDSSRITYASASLVSLSFSPMVCCLTEGQSLDIPKSDKTTSLSCSSFYFLD